LIESRTDIANIEHLLPALTTLYGVECARGGQDFEAFTLYLARRYVGQFDIARQQLADYVTIFRRERGTPSREISDAMLNHANAGS
jgi:hypothetical protein